MCALLIRPATAADVPTLSSLGARTFRETYRAISDPATVDGYADEHFTPAKIHAWLATPGSRTLLASVDDAPIGYAHVLRDRVPACVADRAAVKLSRLYLIAGARGQGHGRALLQAALAAAAELGGRSVWLGSYDRNLRAMAFYAAQGFERVGTHDFEFGGVVHADPVLTRAL